MTASRVVARIVSTFLISLLAATSCAEAVVGPGDPGDPGDPGTPQVPSGNPTLVLSSVHAGNFFSCGLSVAGNAYCWGLNQNKQLGSAEVVDFTNRPRLAVRFGSQFPLFRKLAGSVNHACGITLADQMMCWGVGSGSFGTATPTIVTFTNASRILDVSVGGGHTCALEYGGWVICMGDNQRGQLGIGTGEEQEDELVPVDSGATRFSAVAAGGVHSCGVEQGTQSIRCWGDGFLGQIGDGVNFPTAISISIAGTFNPNSLVAGENHSCALNNAGAAFCWGANGSGQLGDGTTTQRNIPTAVSGGLVFASLYAGEDHTCGVTAAGVAHCWGRNNAGQLGDGTQVDRSAPAAVVGGFTYNSLGLGSLHSCGVASTAGGAGTIATGGTVYCWGDSEYGQAGTGVFRANNLPFLTPTKVANQP